MGSVGRGHDEQAKRRVGEQVFKGAIGGDAGIVLSGIVGVTLEDGGQLQT